MMIKDLRTYVRCFSDIIYKIIFNVDVERIARVHYTYRTFVDCIVLEMRLLSKDEIEGADIRNPFPKLKSYTCTMLLLCGVVC